MRKHLRAMSNMIRELKSAGHFLSDEQRVQVVLHSLPSSWEQMVMTLLIKSTLRPLMMCKRTWSWRMSTFKPQSPPLKCLLRKLVRVKLPGLSVEDVITTRMGRGLVRRRRRQITVRTKELLTKARRRTKLTKVVTIVARHVILLVIVQILRRNATTVAGWVMWLVNARGQLRYQDTLYACFSSCALRTDSYPLWTVDSGATDHITRDRGAFQEYG